MSNNRDTQLSDPLQSNPTLPDDSTSEEEPDPTYAITEEEHSGTIPGSNEATAMALAGQRAIAIPVVEQSKPHRVKRLNPQCLKAMPLLKQNHNHRLQNSK